MTPLFVAISFAAGALATLSIYQLVRPVLGGRMVWPAIAAAVLTTVVTASIGVLTDAARLDYLLGISAFTLPVLVLLEAAAIGSGADRVARWVLMLGWGLIVFPAATLIPPLVTAGCRFDGCGIVDFGGALPLFVSSSAYVLLAWSPIRARPVALDAYVPRILLAGVVGPAAGALGWLMVDTLKATGRPVTRSLGFGFLAGIAATAPGAVTVSFPWSALVGALAGIAAAIIHAAKPLASAGVAPRWGLSLLGATAVGFLAPPISGDTVGILFSAQVGVLWTPIIAFFGVAVGAAVVSAPVWVLLQRRQAT